MRSVVVGALLAMTAGTCLAAGIDGLRFAGIDTTKGIDAVASEMDAVKVGSSPKFSQVVSGKDLLGRDVLIGGAADQVLMLAVSWRANLSANDLRSIGDIEEDFGINVLERIVRETCDDEFNPGPDFACTQIDYACTSEGFCPVRLLSVGLADAGAVGRVRLSWEAMPDPS